MFDFLLPFSLGRRRLIPRFSVQALHAGFALFDSDSDASQSTEATSTTTQTDKRVGVSGEGNITATEGSTINVQSVDKDLALAAYESTADVVDVAVRANAATTQTAISSAQEAARVSNSAMVQTSQAAIASAQESARVAAAAAAQASSQAIAAAQESARVTSSAILAGQDRALDTAERSLDTADRSVLVAAGVASDATENARALVLANNELTEKTREGNQQLVKLVADKLSTAVADERKNINAELVGSVAKWGSVAAVGLALALGLSMAIKRKTA